MKKIRVLALLVMLALVGCSKGNNENTSEKTNQMEVTTEKVTTEKATTEKITTEKPTTEEVKEFSYDFYINDTEGDYKTMMDTFVSGAYPIYMNIAVYDGPLNETIQFKSECVFPDGSVSTLLSDEVKSGTGWSFYYYWYNHDTGDYMDLPKGAYTISVYNAKTSEFLYGKTVQVQ